MHRRLLLISLLSLYLVNAQEDNPVEELLDANLLTDSPILDDTVEKSFFISLLMIIVSEIGDKTFLIAAIMAMKHSRWVVFAAGFSSLALMSVVSAWLGHVVPNLIPKQYTDICASLLFLTFGVRMLHETYTMSDDHDEISEVEDELKGVEDQEKIDEMEAMETGELKAKGAKEGLMNLMQLVFSPVFVKTFVLTFLGEWGDRSQISTIALAAANNVYYVISGVVFGHGLCTALAVIGGRMVATKISVKTVTFSGAILFIVFGVFYGINAYTGLQE